MVRQLETFLLIVPYGIETVYRDFYRNIGTAPFNRTLWN